MKSGLLTIFVCLLLASAMAQGACDIQVDKCCAIFESLGFGSRPTTIAAVKGPHGVTTFTARPTVEYRIKPDPSVANPLGRKAVEFTQGIEELKKDFAAQLEREGVGPAMRKRMGFILRELVQNAADAHVRNGTDPNTRQIVVRLKINRRRRPQNGEADAEPVDEIVMEVIDNAGNPTAQRGAGKWFNGGRISETELARAKTVLDELSPKLINPVTLAKERGLTKAKDFITSKEYQALLKEVEEKNAPIIEKMSEAQLPPDSIAEYFDAKVPDDAAVEKLLEPLGKQEREIAKEEINARNWFWLGTRFGIRAKEIAVENRDAGTGGFGSVVMKEWGTRWLYGPYLDKEGTVHGTRVLYALETPSSSLTRPLPIGYALEDQPDLIVPRTGPGPRVNIIDPRDPPRRPGGPLIAPPDLNKQPE